MRLTDQSWKDSIYRLLTKVRRKTIRVTNDVKMINIYVKFLYFSLFPELFGESNTRSVQTGETSSFRFQQSNEIETNYGQVATLTNSSFNDRNNDARLYASKANKFKRRVKRACIDVLLMLF